jgi:tetratricopeptide (TPR) repeat protein
LILTQRPLIFATTALVALTLAWPAAFAEPPSRPAPGAGSVPGDAQAPAQKPAEKKGLAVAQPRSPAEREKALANLYAHLATASDAEQAKTVAKAIEKLWNHSGSDTVSLLMERAMRSAHDKKPELALKLLDTVVELAPDYTEGWNKRASVHFQRNDVERALGDLRRVLALDANHFGALDALSHILKDIGQKKAALRAMRQLADVHPYQEGLQQAIDELARQVDGQSL